MKYVIVLTMSVLVFVFGCSKKVVPAAAANKSGGAASEMAENAVVSQDASKMDALTASGKSIYLAKCGRCHGLKNTADYSRGRWIHIMDEMAPKANLNATEKIDVLMYVQAFARK